MSWLPARLVEGEQRQPFQMGHVALVSHSPHHSTISTYIFNSMPSLLVCVPHLMLTQREKTDIREGTEFSAGQASWKQRWQRGLTSWYPRSHCLFLHTWAGLSLSCPRWNARRGSSVVLQSYRELDTWELSTGRGKGLLGWELSWSQMTVVQENLHPGQPVLSNTASTSHTWPSST